MQEFYQEISNTKDRYKLYIMECKKEEIDSCVSLLSSQKIPVINIGKNLATFISKLENHYYLNIDALEYVKHLLEVEKIKLDNSGNDVIAVYNLGILFESALTINVALVLKEISKLTTLIIIWENKINENNHLFWPTQENLIFLDFSETYLKKIKYEI